MGCECGLGAGEMGGRVEQRSWAPRIVGGEGLDVRGDALDEAGQDAAGPDLDEGRHAVGGHPLDGGDPVDPGREVLDELGAAGLGGRERAGVGVREERDGRVVEGDAGESASRIPAAASAISGRVGRDGDRQHDRALRAEGLGASSAPASTAARSPETTTWPGALRLATTKMPCDERPGHEFGEMGVVEADQRGHRPVAAVARAPASGGRARGPGGRRRRGRATPAATSAEYWPIEWPAAKAGAGSVEPGRSPALAHAREVRDRGGEEGRLGVLGAVEVARPGPSQASAADRLAERVVGRGEDGRGRRGRPRRGLVPSRPTGSPGRGRRRRRWHGLDRCAAREWASAHAERANPAHSSCRPVAR